MILSIVRTDVLNRSVFSALLSLSICCQVSAVTVSEVWIAEGPPSVPINAGYMQIDNEGEQPVTLVAVESVHYPRIEIHKSTTANGMTGMEPVNRIDIPPGSRLTFAPGELHLMIYNDGKPPQSGESIPLILRFADGSTSATSAVVRKMSDNNHQHGQASVNNSGIWPNIRVAWQYLLPQHFLSALMYRLTRISWPPLKNLLIRNFIRTYNVDMSIAINPDPEQYRHFNEFFTRPLKTEARPINPAVNAIVSPVDGTVSQYGKITDGRLLQAKGHTYSAIELLGGDIALGERFRQGEFITLYLSPRDYHRIHMPVRGTLQSMTYVPGDLFSVNPATTQGVGNLFARNERVVQIFETAMGKVALVMVGAIFVGSMETIWAGEITPAQAGQPYTIAYPGSGRQVQLEKGVEMGRFNMGSTVILLFEQDRAQWETFIRPDQPVRLGQKLATVR